MKTVKYLPLLAGAMALGTAASPAGAQTQEAAAPKAAGAEPAGGAEGGLQDIIVTAQRRGQNLQTVPISISVLDGRTLAQTGVRDPRDLAQLVPGLTFQSGTAVSDTSIFIRGIGISDFNANTTGAVGIYVDDVFIGGNAGKLFNVFDSGGVEVLKGPQGTLYGRNTTAGAIRFSSRMPSDTLSVDASALYGRFDDRRLEGGIGGPLVDGLIKVRIAGLYDRNDGYGRNRVTGRRINDIDMWAARGIVDITPSDTLLLRWIVHGGHNRGDARQAQHVGSGIGFLGEPEVSPAGVPLDGLGYADTDRDKDAGDYDVEGQERLNLFGSSLNAQLKLDQVTLTSITAYESVSRDTLEDTDASPNDIITGRFVERPRQFSEEVRLQSTGERRLTWLLGGYYFRDRLKTASSYDLLRSLRDPTAPLGGFDPAQSIGNFAYPYRQATDSLAAFGQLDFKLSDKLTATAGLRYSHDRIDFDYDGAFVEPTITVPVLSARQRKNYQDLSYRGALTYDIGQGILYASASKGYNSGGFPGSAATDPRQLAPYRSEQLYAYEAGVKKDLLDRILRVDGSVFYYDYKDLQVFIFDVSGALPVQRKLNAGNARVYGAEAGFAVQPTRFVNVTFNGSYLNTKYTSFTALSQADYSGNRLISAPRLAASGSITASQPLNDRMLLRGRLDGSYQSSIYLTPDNAANYRVPAYGLVNAKLSLLMDDERYEIALFGKNITGKRFVTYRSPSLTLDLLYYNEPATYGAQFIAKF